MERDSKSEWNLLTSGAVDIVDREHLQGRLARGDRLRVKFGMDPNRPDIHLGHTVPLRVLRRFQDHGHQAVLIIGDTTAQIGDPSGQSATRPQLSRTEVVANAETYLDQAWKILDESTTEVRWQSEWFDRMQLADLVALMSRYTVAKMLARDDFARRMKEGRPIGFHELLYPLLQAYDSVAVKADLELGGTDQTFNLLVGRDIQQAYGQAEQDILTVPLLEGLDGVQKMSKSLDNYIGVDEPPNVMYVKAMQVPDGLILRYLQLTIDILPQELALEERTLQQGKNPRDVKKRLAKRIVTQFHGAEQAQKAEAAFEEGVKKLSYPTDMPVREIRPGERTVAELFAEVELATSKSEVRRLVAQRGLSVNSKIVTSADSRVTPETGWILQRGSHRFIRLILG